MAPNPMSGRTGLTWGTALGAAAFLPLCLPRAGLTVGLHYASLLRSQWLPREELDALQARKLNTLLRRAAAGVPLYEGCYSGEGITAANLRTRLASLPVLTKERLRQDISVARASRPGWPLLKATTGGTTGDPIEVWKSRESLAVSGAAFWRGLSWLGIRPWDRGVIVYGFGAGSWYGRARMRLTRKWGLEAFGASEQSREATRALLGRLRPVYIEGFITDLLRLGEMDGCREIGIRRVITTAEMLYDNQRAALAERFGAAVADYYGSNEVNSIAFECELGVKHVADEHVLLETVDGDENPVQGKPGRILVTDLDNHAMPFIRYELGDIGVLDSEPCACGRQLTTLRALLGRRQDALRNAEGESLSAVFFAGKFLALRRVRRFQLVQRNLEEVDLFYETALPGPEAEIGSILAEIQARLGPRMVVRPQAVEELPRTAAGKCRLVVGLNESLADGRAGACADS